MSDKLKPWFVTASGGPMGRWPGVMEQGGRIIAFAVPDEKTAQELVDLRAQLAAATTETTEQAWEIAKLRYYVEALERLVTPEERQTAADEASIALAQHNPPEWVQNESRHRDG